MKKLLTAGFFALALVSTGCGKSALNESCDTAGATTDECEDNLICDKDKGTDPVCLKICTSDADCDAATQNCNGVAGSNTKACKTK